jgi:hypothetical protein
MAPQCQNIFSDFTSIKTRSRIFRLPVLNFNAPSPAASGYGSPQVQEFTPSTNVLPVADAEPNPFLEEKGKEPAKSLPSVFATSGATSSAFPPIGKPETSCCSIICPFTSAVHVRKA